MKVGELIAELSEYDENMEVVVLKQHSNDDKDKDPVTVVAYQADEDNLLIA